MMLGSGGVVRQKAINPAQRNAETLFETKNVVEIREVSEQRPSGADLLSLRLFAVALLCGERTSHCSLVLSRARLQIEARTRKDIADKSVQLRQRVGDSHR